MLLSPYSLAGKLKAGSVVVTSHGDARVISVSDTRQQARTYNLEIADFHTYFVGKEHVWVHNACNLLKFPHPESTLKSGSNLFDYNALSKWATEDLVKSLRPGEVEALTVKADGTIMQGNMRTFILQERGYPINSLPRVPYVP